MTGFFGSSKHYLGTCFKHLFIYSFIYCRSTAGLSYEALGRSGSCIKESTYGNTTCHHRVLAHQTETLALRQFISFLCTCTERKEEENIKKKQLQQASLNKNLLIE